MARRMIRDCTGSEKVNRLSVQAERFFYRLMMKADDYGLYHADIRLLRAYLFPLKANEIAPEQIADCLIECAREKLIQLYDHGGKRYLRIFDFGQRLKFSSKMKFPEPPPLPVGHVPDDPGPSGLEVEVEALKEKEKQKAAYDVSDFDNLKKYFGFESEINYIGKWSMIIAFLKKFDTPEKLQNFRNQFEFYKKYKEATGQTIHSFESFIESGWSAENWEHKFKNLKLVTVKGTPSAGVYVQPKRRNDDPEEIAKVKERYEYLKNNPVQETKGAGLGSSIRKELDKLNPKKQ